jgi:ribosomal protein S3
VSLALISLIVFIIGQVVMVIVYAARGGFTVGATKTDVENLKADFEELRAGAVVSNKIHNEDHRDLENLVYRIKDALTSHTGRTINGISYRDEDEHQ